MRKVRVLQTVGGGRVLCSDGILRRYAGNRQTKIGELVWVDGEYVMGWKDTGVKLPLFASSSLPASQQVEDYLIWINEDGTATRYDNGESVENSYYYWAKTTPLKEFFYDTLGGGHVFIDYTRNRSFLKVGDDDVFQVYYDYIKSTAGADVYLFDGDYNLTQKISYVFSDWFYYQKSGDNIILCELGYSDSGGSRPGEYRISYNDYDHQGQSNFNLQTYPGGKPTTVDITVWEVVGISEAVELTDPNGDGKLLWTNWGGDGKQYGTVDYSTGEVHLFLPGEVKTYSGGYASSSNQPRITISFSLSIPVDSYIEVKRTYDADGILQDFTYTELGADYDGYVLLDYDPVNGTLHSVGTYDLSVMDGVVQKLPEDGYTTGVACQCTGAPPPVGCVCQDYYEVTQECDDGVATNTWTDTLRAFDVSKISVVQSDRLGLSGELDTNASRLWDEEGGNTPGWTIPPCASHSYDPVRVSGLREYPPGTAPIDKITGPRVGASSDFGYDFTNWRIATSWYSPSPYLNFYVRPEYVADTRPIDLTTYVKHYFAGSIKGMWEDRDLNGSINIHLNSTPGYTDMNLHLIEKVMTSESEEKLLSDFQTSSDSDYWTVLRRFLGYVSAGPQWAFSAMNGKWNVAEETHRLDGTSGTNKVLLPKWVADVLYKQ